MHPIFTAALFTIAKVEAGTCAPTDEWINKLWSVHTTECYSAMKRNDVLTSYSVMNLENTVSESSQTPKAASLM